MRNDTDHNGKPETDPQFLRFIAQAHLQGPDWSKVENERMRRIANELAQLRAAVPEINEAMVERAAKAIHAWWRDGMIKQRRYVTPNRMKWDTLTESDRELDRYIARAALEARKEVDDV